MKVSTHLLASTAAVWIPSTLTPSSTAICIVWPMQLTAALLHMLIICIPPFLHVTSIINCQASYFVVYIKSLSNFIHCTVYKLSCVMNCQPASSKHRMLKYPLDINVACYCNMNVSSIACPNITNQSNCLMLIQFCL